MYKNFNLTDKERKEILEMHQSNGYKKPMNEYGNIGGFNDFNNPSDEDIEGYEGAREKSDMERMEIKNKILELIDRFHTIFDTRYSHLESLKNDIQKQFDISAEEHGDTE